MNPELNCNRVCLVKPISLSVNMAVNRTTVGLMGKLGHTPDYSHPAWWEPFTVSLDTTVSHVSVATADTLFRRIESVYHDLVAITQSMDESEFRGRYLREIVAAYTAAKMHATLCHVYLWHIRYTPGCTTSAYLNEWDQNLEILNRDYLELVQLRNQVIIPME